MSAPGWYPDPGGGSGQRYFDGTQWTDHRAGATSPAGPPPQRKAGISVAAKITIALAAAFAVVVVIGIVMGNDRDDREQRTAPPPPGPPLGSIAEDGTYKVDDCFGCRVDPGTWQSDGGIGNEYCIWLRRTDLRTGVDNIIERGEAAPNERVRVALKLGEYFTTLGCQPWTFIG